MHSGAGPKRAVQCRPLRRTFSTTLDASFHQLPTNCFGKLETSSISFTRTSSKWKHAAFWIQAAMGCSWRSWAAAVTLLSLLLFIVSRSHKESFVGPKLAGSSGALPIRHGRFAYLVQARAGPGRFWLNVTRRQDSSLIWLTWKEKLPIHPSTFAAYVHFPNSSFSRGRNRLAEEAKKLERKQGWKFSYFVFADEDMFGLRVFGRAKVRADNKVAHAVNSYPPAIYAFNKLLNTYRPARAGGNRQDSRFEPLQGGCIVQPAVDAAIEAFHRSAVDVLLPYDPRFDSFCIWMSGMLMNMKADLFYRESSVLFKSIQWIIFDEKALHATYPRGSLPVSLQKLYRYLHKCWSKSPFATKVRVRYPNAGSLIQGAWRGINSTTKCVPALKNVDYGFGKTPETIRRRWIDETLPGCRRRL